MILNEDDEIQKADEDHNFCDVIKLPKVSWVSYIFFVDYHYHYLYLICWCILSSHPLFIQVFNRISLKILKKYIKSGKYWSEVINLVTAKF